jgi:hypothetical protein
LPTARLLILTSVDCVWRAYGDSGSSSYAHARILAQGAHCLQRGLGPLALKVGRARAPPWRRRTARGARGDRPLVGHSTDLPRTCTHGAGSVCQWCTAIGFNTKPATRRRLAGAGIEGTAPAVGALRCHALSTRMLPTPLARLPRSVVRRAVRLGVVDASCVRPDNLRHCQCGHIASRASRMLCKP